MKLIKILLLLVAIVFVLSLDFSPRKIVPKYGVSFSHFHSDELKLNWKETYLAILNDLGVRNFRFSAHWPLTEPEKGKYDFKELDFQIKKAEEKGAKFILAVGRRLPGWPECHEPEWIKNEISKIKDQKDILKFKNERILEYIKAVVNRYKDSPALEYWQVENEPYLTFFSKETCGKLDESFLDEEISLVKQLDPDTPIIITDSGEFGPWFKAYKKGNVFGTSMYLYIWNHTIGKFRYPIGPWFFRAKHNLVKLFLGDKTVIAIEVSTEPWLIEPITDMPIDIQLERMGIDKFNEMISLSSRTNFDSYYLWGAEWWYWLKLQGQDGHWLRAKELFSTQ